MIKINLAVNYPFLDAMTEVSNPGKDGGVEEEDYCPMSKLH